MITILVIKPGEEPFVQQIKDDLDDINNIIKCQTCEYLTLEHGIYIICNPYLNMFQDKSIPYRKIRNYIIYGTFIVTAYRNCTDNDQLTESVSLNNHQIEKYKHFFRLRK
jgi:hypothetical protein